MKSSTTESASVGPHWSGARRRPGRGTVLVGIALIAAVLAIADQMTKDWAESNLPLLDPQPFLGEFLQLTLLYNTGAAWGMGSEITPVVTCLQIAIVLGVLLFAFTSVRSLRYTLALGLITGGALGNIHDRLLRDPSPFHGAVVDFLELPHWPVFNVADIGVVGGALLIVALGLFGVPADPASVPADETSKHADAAAEASDASTDAPADASTDAPEGEDEPGQRA